MVYAIDTNCFTWKQRVFCDLFMQRNQDGTRKYSAEQAAVLAGYSKASARSIAAENLSKPAIKKYIGMKMKEAIESIGVTKEWRLEMLKKGVELNFEGKATKDGNIDLKGLKGVIHEINLMAGDHAETTSNVNVNTNNLDEVAKIAADSEKEINQIKSF